MSVSAGRFDPEVIKMNQATTTLNAAQLYSRNEVLLSGRIRRPPEQRALPSGDELVTFRLVMTRPERATGTRRAGSDWVDCAVWDRRVRTRAANWRQDDEVEIRGSLRRRFFRFQGSTGTRLEVEVHGGKVLRRAG